MIKVTNKKETNKLEVLYIYIFFFFFAKSEFYQHRKHLFFTRHRSQLARANFGRNFVYTRVSNGGSKSWLQFHRNFEFDARSEGFARNGVFHAAKRKKRDTSTQPHDVGDALTQHVVASAV